jgi:transcriptional regulator with XRE-family HTH domain
MSNADESVGAGDVGSLMGRQIVRIRERQGITQKELALRLGVTKSCLCHWERGSHLPSVFQLVEIARVLDSSLDELIYGRPSAKTAKWQRQRLAEGLRALMGILGSDEGPSQPPGKLLPPGRNQKA